MRFEHSALPQQGGTSEHGVRQPCIEIAQLKASP